MITRTRLAPLALLCALLLPGLGGSWLRMGHACPVAQAPASDAGAMHGDSHGDHGASHETGHGAQCHCVGACHAAAISILSSAAEAPRPAVSVSPVHAVEATVAWFPAHCPLDLLPLPTAPPIA